MGYTSFEDLEVLKTEKVCKIKASSPCQQRSSSAHIAFWSYDCAEPRHIHVQRERNRAKFWLDPVSLGENRGFRPRELRDIERIIAEQREL